MSDEQDNTLSRAIEHSTEDMTGKQRKRFVDILGESLPGVLDSARKETFEGGRTEQEEALHDAYKRDLEKIRQGDSRGLSELKKKYRRRGLKIW